MGSPRGGGLVSPSREESGEADIKVNNRILVGYKEYTIGVTFTTVQELELSLI